MPSYRKIKLGTPPPGTDGQVLTVRSGEPVWETPAAAPAPSTPTSAVTIGPADADGYTTLTVGDTAATGVDADGYTTLTL